MKHELNTKCSNDFINKLEEFLNDYKTFIEMGTESIEGLNVFEYQAVVMIDEVLAKIKEIKGDE